MWEKIVVIVLIVCAIVGIGLSVYRQVRKPCDSYGSSCDGCPLAKGCKKKGRE